MPGSRSPHARCWFWCIHSTILGLQSTDLAQPHDALLVRKPGSDELHDMGDEDQEDDIPGLVVYHFYGPLIFANVGYFIERLQSFVSDPKHPMRRLVIDARAIPSVDFTARVQETQGSGDRTGDCQGPSAVV